MMAANNREARRRRIVERGSDRLAFITGRIQTLPQSASDPLDDDSGLPTSQPSTNHQITSVSPNDDGKVSDSISMKQTSISDPSQSDAYDVGRNLGSSIHESKGKDQMLKPPNLDLIDRASPSSSSIATTLEGSRDATLSNPSTNAIRTEPRARCQSFGFMPFNSTHLSSAIVASQMTRILCSIIVAVIVVLSHIGFPLLGSKLMKSTIISRPVYFTLLTNITIVIARLISKKQADTNRPAKRENEPLQDDGNDWATQVGRTLEAGLVMRSVADAVFMDFGVYAVTVVSCLSLVQAVGRIFLV